MSCQARTYLATYWVIDVPSGVALAGPNWVCDVLPGVTLAGRRLGHRCALWCDPSWLLTGSSMCCLARHVLLPVC